MNKYLELITTLHSRQVDEKSACCVQQVSLCTVYFSSIRALILLFFRSQSPKRWGTYAVIGQGVESYGRGLLSDSKHHKVCSRCSRNIRSLNCRFVQGTKNRFERCNKSVYLTPGRELDGDQIMGNIPERKRSREWRIRAEICGLKRTLCRTSCKPINWSEKKKEEKCPWHWANNWTSSC